MMKAGPDRSEIAIGGTRAVIPPIIDTSVLVDMFVTTRPRHERALALVRQLQRLPVPVQIPMTAMFELAAAMKEEGLAGRLKVSGTNFTPEAPLTLTTIDIDQAFFTRYYDAALPPIKAGDLIFLALAKGTGAALITEDQQLLRIARECGIIAYTIKEYLESGVGTFLN